jgi:hypothetical protein
MFQQTAAIATPSITQSSPSTHGPQASHSVPYEYDSTLAVGGISGWSAPNLAQPIDSSNQFSLLTDNLNRPDAASIDMTNAWMFSPSHQFPGWLVDEEFDLSALCANIPPSGTSLPMDWSSHGFFTGDRPQMNDSSDTNIIIEGPSDIISESKEEKVKRHWFTYLGPERSGQVTPDGTNESTCVDERYREDLSRELQQRKINYEPLPSTDFLVLTLFILAGGTAQLTIIESMHTNVLYEIPSDIPDRACTDISAICKAVFAIDLNLFGGKSISWITIRCGSRE